MRRDAVTLHVVMIGLGRLTNAFGPPYRRDQNEFGKELLERVRSWTEIELSAAVTQVISTEKSFPSIAAILMARPHVERSTPAPQEFEGTGACYVCKRVPFLVGWQQRSSWVTPGKLAVGSGEVFGRARCGCPEVAPGWFTPAAEAWRDDPNWVGYRGLKTVRRLGHTMKDVDAAPLTLAGAFGQLEDDRPW